MYTEPEAAPSAAIPQFTAHWRADGQRCWYAEDLQLAQLKVWCHAVREQRGLALNCVVHDAVLITSLAVDRVILFQNYRAHSSSEVALGNSFVNIRSREIVTSHILVSSLQKIRPVT